MNSVKHRKIFPIVATASAAAALFTASLMAEALGDDLKLFFAPILPWWKWLLGSALAITVTAAVWDRWRAEEPADATKGDVVHGNKTVNIYQQPTTDHQPPTTNRLRQITSPPKDFIGRKVELRELLADLESGAVISGVQGQGGIGKTALALKLAEALASKFTGAQIFLDLQGMSEQPVKTTSAMEHVIRSFHPESGQLPDTVAGLQPLYQSILQNELSEGRRVLLLFDNAKDRAQVEPLIPPAGCVMLVTSRAHFTLSGMRQQNLEALQLEDALALLTQLCDRCGTEAEELVELCGRLPMALRIVGSFLRERRDYPVARYLEKLRAARLDQLPEVAASLKLSCEQLPPELLARWRGLSVFADSFDPDAAAAVLAIDPGEAQDALSEMARYSLLDWDEAEQRYSLHDLARDYADSQLADDKREKLKLNHAQHFCEVLAEAGRLYLEGGERVTKGLGLFDRERANIEAGQAWATSRSDAVPAAAELCVEYPDAGVYVLSLRQHSRDRIRWLEIQLAVARRLKRRSKEGNALGNLGIAYADLGETRKAIEFYEQALVIDREIGDRRGEGADLGNLGLAYADLGETRKAIEFYEQALVVSREIGNKRAEGTILGNLGLAYADLGETRKAIEFYEQHVAIAREIGDRRGEGNALGNLGLAYADLGETRKAIEFYEQQLVIVREIGDRCGEGNSLGNLGSANYLLGETRKAIEFYEQQLVIVREIGDRRGEGNSLWNTALALDRLGEREKAIAWAEAALKIREEIEDPNAARVREQLAEWRS